MRKKEIVAFGIESGQFESSIYKYNAFNENLLDSLRESYIWFSNPKTFNDPFDCNITIEASGEIQDYEKWLRDSEVFQGSELEIKIKAKELIKDPTLKTRINLQSNRLISEIGIACFSYKYDNVLMWSYYTGSHKGVCLEYDLLQLFSEDMTPFRVRYNSKYPEYNHITKSGDHDGVISTLGVKADFWEHEQEFRIVSTNQGKNKIPRSALKRIIFGCNAEDKSKIEILKVLRENYDIDKVTINNLKLMEKYYGLEIVS